MEHQEQEVHQEKLDYAFLRRELDRCKSSILMDAKNAFLGALMCQLKQDWDESIPTACTNGKSIWWSPHWFLSLPKPARVTVQAHEVWHVARLHMIRRGNRDPRLWNYACVAENTRVAMADGTEKFVQDIQAGDQIAASDSGTSTVAVKINSGAKDIYEIVLESGRVLRCSADHKVLTDAGFKNADTLTSGETCFVDTRYGKPIENQLGNQKHPGNC